MTDAEQARIAEAAKAGINKLFDAMQNDLGTQQTEEMKNFYQKMSNQIKELCHDEPAQ